ncbi:MAG TPA: prenyltransferase/squalene oxidase repeat-containing protein [Thermoanaerobaculia bacterium]
MIVEPGPGGNQPSAPFPPWVRRQAETTSAAVAALQAAWPDRVILGAAEPSLYDYFPYLFLAAFPALAEADLQQFAVAARLYATSIFLHDKIYDREGEQAATAPLAPVNGLRILAMQWEAYRILHRLFAPDASFWPRFQGHLAGFAHALIEEQQFVVGGRPWTEYTEEVALGIARGKNGVAKATVAGLAELARAPDRGEPLAAAIDCFSVAQQAMDDLCDWKEDLRNGVPTLLLARVLDKPPPASPAELEPWIESVGREIYYGGHARYSLTLAIASLADADRLTADVPDLAWRQVCGELRQRCERLLADADRIIGDNLRRAATQPRFRLQLPSPAGPWQPVAWDALRFVVEQWRLGFGEARHLMEFPHDQGFTGEHELQRGDVFQRAVIADVLCDAGEQVRGLRPVIDHEISYLLGRRGAARGGWRYFPELPELPPDADDLAQIMQVLLRRGRLDDVHRHCAGPLSILLDDNRHRDGSFETWIIPARGRTPEEQSQARHARLSWGTGADSEVMANLFYALVLFDPSRFARTIARGTGYLLRQQRDDGSWTSTWYRGPYYGTYACVRLLRAISPAMPAMPATPATAAAAALMRAAEFLCRTQRDDGGWGAESESNALDTALALAGLAALGGLGARRGQAAAERAECARAYLCRSRQGDRSWPAWDLIRMDTGRASGTAAPVLTYGSSTMTTAFVLKAALAWHRLTGSPSPARPGQHTPASARRRRPRKHSADSAPPSPAAGRT